jgi:D-glycero-D-manno-heptose 1,7-bisphosphate phosphatase
LKVAFLDRDGTIVEDYGDELWRNVAEPIFIDGSIEALA